MTNPNQDPSAELELWSKAAHAAQYNIKLLAQHSRMTRKQLRHYFQTRFQHTPKQFLDRLRAAQAAQDLRHGASPKEVASSYLYSDTAHLYHALKRHLHITPSEIIGRRGTATTIHVQAFLSFVAQGPFLQHKEPFLQNKGLGEQAATTLP